MGSGTRRKALEKVWESRGRGFYVWESRGSLGKPWDFRPAVWETRGSLLGRGFYVVRWLAECGPGVGDSFRMNNFKSPCLRTRH